MRKLNLTFDDLFETEARLDELKNTIRLINDSIYSLCTEYKDLFRIVNNYYECSNEYYKLVKNSKEQEDYIRRHIKDVYVVYQRSSIVVKQLKEKNEYWQEGWVLCVCLCEEDAKKIVDQENKPEADYFYWYEGRRITPEYEIKGIL